MKSKRNAFTLIELLAIIVILAIIAVITVPIILNIIENSRMGAATDSAYGYKDAVNKAYVQELAKPNQGGLKLNGTYEVQDDGTLVPADGYSFGITNYNTLPVSVSGDKPSSGELTYDNNVLKSGTLIIGDYTATYSNGAFTVVKTSSISNESAEEQSQGGGEEQPSSVPTIASCPGCVFANIKEIKWIKENFTPEIVTDMYPTLMYTSEEEIIEDYQCDTNYDINAYEDEEDYEEDYNNCLENMNEELENFRVNYTLKQEEYTDDYTTLNKNYFQGFVLNEKQEIQKAYSCGINNIGAFCLEGSTQIYNEYYDENIDILKHFYPSCNIDEQISQISTLVANNEYYGESVDCSSQLDNAHLLDLKGDGTYDSLSVSLCPGINGSQCNGSTVQINNIKYSGTTIAEGQIMP